MEMHQVRYFLAACDALNFTRAAEICHVSQPALTKAIKLLEEELGGALLDRRLRPMRLTRLGERLRERFAAISGIAADIKAEANLYSRNERENAAVGIVNTLGAERSFALIEALAAALPETDLSFRHCAQADLLMALAEGDLECAVIADCEGAGEGFDYAPLFTERYFLAVSPSHPMAKKGAISLRELGGASYIHRVHCELNDRTEALLREKGIEVGNRFTTDQDDLARRMIAGGLGVAILPDCLFAPALAKCAIVDESLERTISLARARGRAPAPLAERIGSAVIAHFAAAPSRR